MCLRPLLCSMPILFLLWHLSPILHPLREPFFQLSFSSSKDPPLGIQTSKADTHLYAWLPSSTEHLLSWRGIKRIFLSSFLGIYRFASMLSRRRNAGIPKIRIEIAICRFAAVKKLGTSVFLLPISISSRTAYSISVLKLVACSHLFFSWLEQQYDL